MYRREEEGGGRRGHEKNPFDDSNDTQEKEIEFNQASTSHTGQERARSIIMARGAFSKGITSFADRELLPGGSDSNRDLFELLIPPQDNNRRAIDKSPMKYGSLEITGNHPGKFSPRNYGLTRNQLMDSHSRGLSGSTNDLDSFALESTYEGYHTANGIQATQQSRGGTPPNRLTSYYHQSPSYSTHGDISGARSTPALVAQGPGSNAAGTLEESSTTSFTNTFPSTVQEPFNHAGKFPPMVDTNAAILKLKKSKKKNKIKAKKSKFSPNSTAVSAVSTNLLYSGLNDMQLGFFMSTYNGGEPPDVRQPKVAKTRGFPTELSQRPAQPIRVTAEARAQYNARKEDQRLALERRLAIPHLIRRPKPASIGLGVSFKLLTRNAWVWVSIVSFGFFSMSICLAVIITIKNVGVNPSQREVSVPIIWWLAISALVFCSGGVGTLNILRVRGTIQHSNTGFRRHVGSREIIDGSLGRNVDLEGGANVESFEMVSGAIGSPVPLPEAFSSFDTPQRVEDAYTHNYQAPRVFKQFSVRPLNFDQVSPLHRTGEAAYFDHKVYNPEVNEADNTGFMAESPATPLSPLPQAVLSPITTRHENDFSVDHYRTLSRPSALVSIPAPDVLKFPESMPNRGSARSRDSLVEAAVHRDLAMRTLLGETPDPDTTLGITDIYNGGQISITPTVLSQTSTYSYMPPALKRVETEGPLAKLEKSLTDQSQQIATEQEIPALSRNPYRDSMKDNGETLPATYYTGNSKGKGRAYD